MAHDHRVEPARSARSARGRAVFAAALADRVADLIVKLGRERTVADAGRVALAHAYDLVDDLGTHARSDARAARYRMRGRYKRVRTEVYIEQCRLRALEQDLLASLMRLKRDDRAVRHIFFELLAVCLVFLINSVKIHSLAAVELLDREVLDLARVLDELFKALRVNEIVHTYADTVRLIGVARTYAAPRRTDVYARLTRFELFLELVELSVPRHNDVGSRVYAEIVAGNAALVHLGDLFQQYRGIYHHAAAYKANGLGIEYPRRQEVQLIHLISVYHGVTRVVSAARANDQIRLSRHYVNDLALAFVAPLRSDYDPCAHNNSVLFSVRNSMLLM